MDWINYVRIESLKVRYDITKLDLTVPLLFFWCIDIDLNIEPMSLTLFMDLGNPIETENAPSPNWRDGLFWPLG